VIEPAELGLGGGSFDDLLPVPELDATVEHFLGLLRGEGPVGALNSICFNAAAMALNGQVVADWAAGIELARETLRSGAAVSLIDRVKAAGAPSAPSAA
jgi:anthranilate phosphoribosyltransferase